MRLRIGLQESSNVSWGAPVSTGNSRDVDFQSFNNLAEAFTLETLLLTGSSAILVHRQAFDRKELGAQDVMRASRISAEQNRSKIHREFPHRSKLRRSGLEPINRVLLPPR